MSVQCNVSIKSCFQDIITFGFAKCTKMRIMTKTAQFELCNLQGTQNTETAAHRYLRKMAV